MMDSCVDYNAYLVPRDGKGYHGFPGEMIRHIEKGATLDFFVG